MKAMESAARRKNLKLWLEVAASVPSVVIGDAVRLRQIVVKVVGMGSNSRHPGKSD